jgi:hypothetical protein
VELRFAMTRDARLSALHRGDGAVCCGDKGLDCLPAANGTTGALRLFTAVSHRAARLIGTETQDHDQRGEDSEQDDS